MSELKQLSKFGDPLPVPPHYDPDKVGEVWRVHYQQRAEEAQEWSRRFDLHPASQDEFRVALIGVDLQNTFCIPGFELFVGGRSGMGAVEDNRRLCEFIYRNMGMLTHISLTMDTHNAMQIFHPVFLVDENGDHPDPLTLVAFDEIQSGRWKFNPDLADSLGISAEYGQEHLFHYTNQLKVKGKYDLTIWPYHAMLGGIGHALVSSVEEAVFFHTIARNSQPKFEVKGDIATTESYSVIGPEVLVDSAGEPIAQKNENIVQMVSDFDLVVIAGQAKSHCVAWTIEDLLSQIQARDPGLAKKVYLLEDCTSPVVVPGIVDYTDQAEAVYGKFAEAGMQIIQSSDPITNWPGN